jgi:hypothetical protein
VRRSNSNSPSFAFNLLCGAVRDPQRIEQFLYKKACRSRREILALITGLFRSKPFSGARAVSGFPSVLMQLPPFHGHAVANTQQHLEHFPSTRGGTFMRVFMSFVAVIGVLP